MSGDERASVNEAGEASEQQQADGGAAARFRSNAWTDLALTMPIFIGYHVGVVLLRVRNAADIVTAEIVALAENNLPLYWALTVCIGLSVVAVFASLGRGEAFEGHRFAAVAAEGVVYAVLMRFAAGYVVGSLPLVAGAALASPALGNRGAAVVMSLGAGFYEELAFRVGVFGLGARVVRWLWPDGGRVVALVLWALLAAAAFSGWHYIGDLGDVWNVRTFVFRWVCGIIFTLIFVFRGFAAAVWTHALYDVWVLALR